MRRVVPVRRPVVAPSAPIVEKSASVRLPAPLVETTIFVDDPSSIAENIREPPSHTLRSLTYSVDAPWTEFMATQRLQDAACQPFFEWILSKGVAVEAMSSKEISGYYRVFTKTEGKKK